MLQRLRDWLRRHRVLRLAPLPVIAVAGFLGAGCHSSDPYAICDASMPNTIITFVSDPGDAGQLVYCQGVNDSYGGLCWYAWESDHRAEDIIGWDAAPDNCP